MGRGPVNIASHCNIGGTPAEFNEFRKLRTCRDGGNHERPDSKVHRVFQHPARGYGASREGLSKGRCRTCENSRRWLPKGLADISSIDRPLSRGRRHGNHGRLVRPPLSTLFLQYWHHGPHPRASELGRNWLSGLDVDQGYVPDPCKLRGRRAHRCGGIYGLVYVTFAILLFGSWSMVSS